VMKFFSLSLTSRKESGLDILFLRVFGAFLEHVCCNFSALNQRISI
jgi:hypothetical protein